MSFHISQPVWIQWHYDCHAPWARCTNGTIVGGPFPPGLYGGFQYREQNWAVDSDEGGPTIRAVESVLLPFNPPDREVESEREMEAT